MFKQAATLAGELMRGNLQTDNLTYSPKVAGIIITYAKNFFKSDGLMPLDQSFNDFKSLDMYQTHGTAIIVRDQIYAHSDVTAAQHFKHDDDDAAQTYEVKLTLGDELRSCDASVLLPDLPIGFLTNFVALCDLQRSRCSEEIVRLVETIRSTWAYPPGEYVVGEDFP